jgi:hypothetical protein
MAYDLIFTLPTKNRPQSLHKTIQSFVNLDLNNCLLFVLDNGEKNKHFINNQYLSVEDIVLKFNKYNIVYRYFNKDNQSYFDYYKTFLYEHFKEKKNFPKYWATINDDDIFVFSDGINKQIEILDTNSDIAITVTNIELFDENKKRVDLNLQTAKYSPIDFLKKFSNDISLQHCTQNAIFRLENMLESNCFDTLGLYKYGLWDGFGIDLNWYFRPAFYKKSIVLVLSDVKPSKRLFQHTSSMTGKYPVMFSYCYYLYFKENIEYLKKNYLVKNKIFFDYKVWWLKQLMTSCLSEISMERYKSNKNMISNHLKSNILYFIFKECLSLLNIKLLFYFFFFLKKYTYYKYLRK